VRRIHIGLSGFIRVFLLAHEYIRRPTIASGARVFSLFLSKRPGILLTLAAWVVVDFLNQFIARVESKNFEPV
jgi:hypothetical protein